MRPPHGPYNTRMSREDGRSGACEAEAAEGTGRGFAQGEVRPEYIPVDEDHPTVPQDSYAMSKVVNEVTARSFQARMLT